eukprot:TRINITY_DN3919_c0_g1_i1.p1 TRINITY_DN3919_c0_g1~~TRINITY_DN3919_c0_g1_i1.p1  ORF type:complete len:56 (-),score=6.07 TRINITY_DN3919_c0_g1_i1:213-380(-)
MGFIAGATFQHINRQRQKHRRVLMETFKSICPFQDASDVVELIGEFRGMKDLDKE